MKRRLSFLERKIVGDNYWSWSFLVSSLKIVPYATTDRNSATAGDDDVTTSGLDVVICGVKTDIGNKSGRRRNLYCVLYILYFFTYFTTSTWGGHKEAWRIICNYRSERKNTISADAFFFWEIRSLLLTRKPLRKVWTNSLLFSFWIDLSKVNPDDLTKLISIFAPKYLVSKFSCLQTIPIAQKSKNSHSLHFASLLEKVQFFFFPSLTVFKIKRALYKKKTLFVKQLTLEGYWYGC